MSHDLYLAAFPDDVDPGKYLEEMCLGERPVPPLPPLDPLIAKLRDVAPSFERSGAELTDPKTTVQILFSGGEISVAYSYGAGEAAVNLAWRCVLLLAALTGLKVYDPQAGQILGPAEMSRIERELPS